MEKIFVDKFWSELVRQTTSSSAYSSVTITKINFSKIIFVFTSTTPITEVLTLEFQ